MGEWRRVVARAVKRDQRRRRRNTKIDDRCQSHPGLHSEKEESNIIVKTNLVDTVETGRNVE